jgi:hypothetical protein
MGKRQTRGMGQATYEAVVTRVRNGQSVKSAARAVGNEFGLTTSTVSSTYYRYAQHDPESRVRNRERQATPIRIMAAVRDGATDSNGNELRPLDVVAALTVLEEYIRRIEDENRELRAESTALHRISALLVG